MPRGRRCLSSVIAAALEQGDGAEWRGCIAIDKAHARASVATGSSYGPVVPAPGIMTSIVPSRRGPGRCGGTIGAVRAIPAVPSIFAVAATAVLWKRPGREDVIGGARARCRCRCRWCRWLVTVTPRRGRCVKWTGDVHCVVDVRVDVGVRASECMRLREGVAYHIGAREGKPGWLRMRKREDDGGECVMYPSLRGGKGAKGMGWDGERME